jgi:hypothetical protein
MKRAQEILKKCTALASKPNAETFPELVDCIVWLRFGLAIAYGLYLGPKIGAIKLLFGLNVVTFVPIMYCQLLLLADMDSYQSLHFAGVPNALGMLLLVWVFACTLHYTEDEMKLAAALVLQQVVARQDPDDVAVAGDVAAAAAVEETVPIPVQEETEF